MAADFCNHSKLRKCYSTMVDSDSCSLDDVMPVINTFSSLQRMKLVYFNLTLKLTGTSY